MINIGGIILGLLLLAGGGAALVHGASQVANRIGISPLIVGLTIVAFGTSTPEFVVNLISAFHGEVGLVFGNVIGSNIANLGLVLGLAAIMQPIVIQGDVVRREVPLLLLATTIITVMALDGPLHGLPAVISRADSTVLLLLFGSFMYIVALNVIRSRRKDPLLEEIIDNPLIPVEPEGRLAWLLLIAGPVLLFAGAEITVRSSVSFASYVGISTTIVGLFIVAIGTSAPELITSIIAAMRKESDLALGNVVGSNIFNILFVLPASGLISDITIPKGGATDIAVSWFLAAALIPIFIFGRAMLGRTTAFLLLAVYCGYAFARTVVNVN